MMTAGAALPVAAGCRTGEPRRIKPAFELPATFTVSGTEPMPGQWWQSLDDPPLAAVIEQALADNFTIRSAWARLTQAEQIAVQAGAALYPAASYTGGAQRVRQETAGTTAYASDYSAGLIAAYEVDLWGRIRSGRQAAVLDAESAAADVSAAAMSLSAAIAKLWYQLGEAKLQEQIILDQIDTNEKILNVITVQFRQGQVGAADVFNQQQLVQSSQGQLIQVREDIVLLQHQLSVLTGRAPGLWWAEEPIGLIGLGDLPQVDVPAVVIQRRPDVRSAYLTVQAADRRLASAIADRYPSVSISAATETFAERTSELFDDWLANLAANLTGPLFDAGLRRAEVRRTRAVVAERLSTYSQTVLEALQETEDALGREFYQRRYVESLQKQLELARNVYERTYQNYLKGRQDYIRVLTALVTMQSLEQRELTARRVLIEHRIDLCRSIAGGWPMQRPDETQLISQSLFEKESE